MKSFSDLTEQELLALAISSEDDDARAYAGFAHSLMDTYPASAKVFMEMAEKEHEHRRWLLDLAEAEKGNESIAVKLGTTHLAADAKIEEGEAKRRLAGHRGGFRRALGDLVDPLPVHGYAFTQGDLPKCCRRLSGVPHGYPDRQCLRAQASLISTAPTTIRAAPARRGRLTVSFRTRIESSITMRIEVSRSAATLAMGALVMAQMAIQ